MVHHALQVFERSRVIEGYEIAVKKALETFVFYWNPLNIEAVTEPVPTDGWLPRQSYSELRNRGIDCIKKYAELVRFDDHELLATEYGFVVPIDGTWDDDLGEPHLLGGSVDRLAVRHFLRKEAVCIDDYKCLALGTSVVMADGSRRAVETIAVGDLVVGWQDGQAGEAVVEASRLNGVKPCVKVVSTYGVVVTTEDHPFLVGDSWVQAAELKPGDLLTIGLGHPGKGDFDPYEAWALGVLVGDGYLGDHVKITQSDDDVIDELRVTLPFALNGGSVARPSDYWFSNEIKPWLESHGLLGRKSKDKFIPEAVINGGREAWLHFLAGWLDTDGYVRLGPTANVVWATTSWTLAEQARDLLLNLGVLATAVAVDSRYKGEPYRSYQVKASRAHGVSLLRQLPLRGKKRHNLARIPEINDAGPRGRWPAYGQDAVKSVTPVGERETWALTVAGGTHITGNVVTHNTGKEYRFLRHNLQFTAYAYASTKLEFWTGWRGEDGFGEERGRQLFERFEDKGRRGTWINMRTFKFQDAGWRGELDYERFRLAVNQITASIKADIFPLTISGEACTYCEFRSLCGGMGVPADDYGQPGRAA